MTTWLPRLSWMARIEPRGRDSISAGGRTWTLDRFSVGGVLWGRETLWADDSGTLQAVVSVDAEFDHFEAVRPELEDAVPQLVARAASDGSGHAFRLSAVARGILLMLVGATALFALAHLPDQGVPGATQAAITGAVIGLLYLGTRRLWIPMFAHAAFDLTAVALIYWNLEERVAHLLFK